jgi:hypothetical protein
MSTSKLGGVAIMGELKPRIKSRGGWWVVDLPIPPKLMTLTERCRFVEAYFFCDCLNGVREHGR